jgi:hypothetical protein
MAWLGKGVGWTGSWERLPRKLLSCWVGDGAKGVWGGELTYGKSVEKTCSDGALTPLKISMSNECRAGFGWG